MEINVNNKIFTKIYLKIRVRGKEISYYIISLKKVNHMMNIYQRIPTRMKTCFSDGKLTKQFETPSLSKRPLSLLSKHVFLCNFFMTTLCPNFKKKTPPPRNFRGGEGNCVLAIRYQLLLLMLDEVHCQPFLNKLSNNSNILKKQFYQKYLS